MKKIIYFLLVFVLIIASCFSLTACSNEDNEETAKGITVFSWEDYIDLGDEEVPGRESSILDDFEEETGIHVNYITFANSEEMYNELEKNPNACDLLCPSEYMIMKMMTEGKLRSFTTPENYKNKCSPFIKDTFKKLGIKNEKGELITPIMSENEETTYACGYMWGTMGYVYDTEKFDEEEFSNWDCILDEKFFDKCSVKDSVRDTYIMAVGAVYKDELMLLKEENESGTLSDEKYNEEITKIFNRCDQETVDKVEEFLIKLRDNLYYFEVDNAKSDILRGRLDLYFAWSGDAVYAMDSGDEIGVTLGYAVPTEGSNIWFDGFVMPKSVSDERAKLVVEFLDYISRPESAVRNMEYIGYVSVISGDAEEPFELSYIEYDDAGNTIEGSEYTCEYTGVLDWVEQNYCVESEDDEDFVETVDLSYFFGDEASELYSYDHGRQLYGLYSDTETIKRCAIMDNFNDEALTRVNKMWNSVKFTTMSTTWLIVIVALFVLGIVAIIVFKNKDKLFKIKPEEKIKTQKKKKDKIIKTENL